MHPNKNMKGLWRIHLVKDRWIEMIKGVWRMNGRPLAYYNDELFHLFHSLITSSPFYYIVIWWWWWYDEPWRRRNFVSVYFAVYFAIINLNIIQQRNFGAFSVGRKELNYLLLACLDWFGIPHLTCKWFLVT